MGDQAQTSENRPTLHLEDDPPPSRSDLSANSELTGVRGAIADASAVASGLWISFLFTLFYLAVAIASVTHEDLLFQTPIKLPFLNIGLPMTTFFMLGPIIFFVVHANMLIYFVFLARKIQHFNQELVDLDCLSKSDLSVRDQLPSNTFVQVLAGPPQFRHGWFGDVLGLIFITTLVMAPLGLLLFFQIQFLPYHDEMTLWLQRGVVTLDMAMLCALWPRIWLPQDNNRSLITGRRLSYIFISSLGMLSFFFSTTVATFPYEALERHLKPVTFIPILTTTGYSDDGKPIRSVVKYSLHDVLFGGAIDTRTERPKSLWSNRLFVANLDPTLGVDPNDHAAGRPLSLRGRRLEGAILYGADLREVDFSGANLQGAYLINADLRGARFHCAATDLYPDAATLSTGRVDEACTHLEGATFDGARMEDADLDDAQLQGASMRRAQLQGATLDRANLEGADLEKADLDATSLDSADLRAAQLRGATLRGAQLTSTQLQGATLDAADIDSSELDGVYLWRTRLNGVTVENSILTAPIWDAQQLCAGEARTSCAFGPAEYANLRKAVETVLPRTGNLHGNRNLNRDRALKWLALRLDPAATERARGADRASLFRRPPTGREFQESRAAQWRKTACAVVDEPYPLWGVEERLQEEAGDETTLDPALLALVGELLKGDHCPGMIDLAANRKQQLEQLVPTSP